jgi:hypothetical protein
MIAQPGNVGINSNCGINSGGDSWNCPGIDSTLGIDRPLMNRQKGTIRQRRRARSSTTILSRDRWHPSDADIEQSITEDPEMNQEAAAEEATQEQ